MFACLYTQQPVHLHICTYNLAYSQSSTSWVSTGGAHAGLGLVNSPAAGTVSITKVSMDLHLSRALPSMAPSAPEAATAAALLRGHVEFIGVASQCCPTALWSTVTALQQLQQQQQQQQQQQRQMVRELVPSSASGSAQPLSGQLQHRRHTNEEPSTSDASAVAAAALLGDELHDPHHSDPASEQPCEDPFAQHVPSEEAASEAAQEAASAVAPVSEPALSIQWELCLQASSVSQVQVVDDTGAVLINCGVDMMTVRAASGDGSNMAAKSAADIVAQLSVEVTLTQLVLPSVVSLPNQELVWHADVKRHVFPAVVNVMLAGFI